MTDSLSLGTKLANAEIVDGQHITGNLEFYVLNTLNALTETEYSAADAGQNLLRVGEILGLGAQPVILGLHTITGVDLTVSANQTLYGLGSSIDGSSNSTLTAATVYQLKISFEHNSAFVTGTQDGTVAGTLAATLKNETVLAALPVTTTISGGHTLNTFVFTGVTQSSSLSYSSIL